MEYFVGAYVVIWLVIFVFVFLMNRRLGALDDQLTMLEEALKRQEQKSSAPAVTLPGVPASE